MRILWYWPHPHPVLHPGAEPLIRAGDSLTVQCLSTHRGRGGDDPRVEFRRELPEVARLQPVPPPLRRVLRVETYVRRAVMRERLVRSGGYDVCHVGMLNYLTDAYALPRLRRLVPVVAVVHDVLPHEARLPERVERHLLRRVYDSADVYVVLHEAVRDRLVAEFGVESRRIVVGTIPVARAEPASRPAPANPTEQRGPTRFLFFGTLRSDKGVPVLLEAARLLAGDSASHIHVAGGGDARLEKMVAAATVRGEITSEVGWVSPARKEQLLEESDVVVLPYSDATRFVSQSGVLGDAYAHRKPVIVADVGAIGPTVSADKTGWVVPAGRADALAERIRLVARDEEARRAATATIECILPNYSHERFGQTLRRAYELAISTR